MQQEDDLRGLAKTMNFTRAISVLFIIMNIYWFCYGTLKEWGTTINVLDKILLNFNKTTGLFSNILNTKIASFVFLGLSCLGTRSVKNKKITWQQIVIIGITGFVLFFINSWILTLSNLQETNTLLYTSTLTVGYLCLLSTGAKISRLLKNNLMDDVFNRENESFMQEMKLIENEYSINLPTKFYYKKKEYRGWINIINPARGIIVIGNPGSGKSFAVLNNVIKQEIEKGYSMLLYDYKFPDLTIIAYNHLLKFHAGYKVPPKFYILNFDDPHKSHRCNPINPNFMLDIADAYESAYIIMLNLNRNWIEKAGDFFVESPIILLAAVIWFLKIYKNGKFCTFPHVVELLNKQYEELFAILTSYPQLENYLSAFVDAWKSGAQDQLQGQIASAKIPLSRMISPALYWTMSGDDFTLDLNNPQNPKLVAIGNNPDRQSIYSSALALYTSRIAKLVNRKGMLKCGINLDEVATFYFKSLDNILATGRSNKISVCLGLQDFSQLRRDYGEKESKVIENIVGNIICGQVVADTAKILSERFGKILQQREGATITSNDRTQSISTQLDSLIPASKISSLSQGEFVGAVVDNWDQKITQKIFHCEIVIDTGKVRQEESNYVDLPVINSFLVDGCDKMQEIVEMNYNRIKNEATQIIIDEMKRIKADPKLKHLIKNKEG